jgi:hypothetical protein
MPREQKVISFCSVQYSTVYRMIVIPLCMDKKIRIDLVIHLSFPTPSHPTVWLYSTVYRMIVIPLCMDQKNLNFDLVILSYSISPNSLAKPLYGAHGKWPDQVMSKGHGTWRSLSLIRISSSAKEVLPSSHWKCLFGLRVFLTIRLI